jgi:hypothetical protein
MKRLLALCILLTGAVCAFAQQGTVTLDEGIKNVGKDIIGHLKKGDRVAILNVSADNKALSTYVIDNLTAYIANDGNLTLVDRQNQDLVLQELDFQMSGMVDEDTAQALGRTLGAQTIISGSLSEFGTAYRMMIQATQVGTSEIQSVSISTVRIDASLFAPSVKKPDRPPGELVFAVMVTWNGKINMGDSLRREIETLLRAQGFQVNTNKESATYIIEGIFSGAEREEKTFITFDGPGISFSLTKKETGATNSAAKNFYNMASLNLRPVPGNSWRLLHERAYNIIEADVKQNFIKELTASHLLD